MNQSPVPSPSGDTPVNDRDRQNVARQIQHAMLNDRVGFDELDDRFAAVYAAQTRAELDAVVSDLPVPPPPVRSPGHPLANSGFSLIGDTKIGGWVTVESDLTYASVLGDVTIDLSSALIDRDITVTVRSLIGDSVVIVPDGVRASLQSFNLLGDRKEILVPPNPGAPTVRVVMQGLLGDARLYSLSQVPEGKFRRLWRALRQS